jgi:hypothetical protein
LNESETAANATTDTILSFKHLILLFTWNHMLVQAQVHNIPEERTQEVVSGVRELYRRYYLRNHVADYPVTLEQRNYDKPLKRSTYNNLLHHHNQYNLNNQDMQPRDNHGQNLTEPPRWNLERHFGFDGPFGKNIEKELDAIQALEKNIS